MWNMLEVSGDFPQLILAGFPTVSEITKIRDWFTD